MKDYLELMKKEEDLLPELQAYYEDEGLFPMVRHPLVFSVPHSEQMNAVLNESYRVKKDVANKAFNENNFDSYIAIHERPYRLYALTKWLERFNVKPSKYWSMLSFIYSDSENIYQNFDQWFELLTSERPCQSYMMEEDERKSLDEMPDVIRVYRGYKYHDISNWLSWTTDIMTATFFANRFNKDGKIATGFVQKSDVIAYISGRNESEIIVNIDHVEKIEMEVK